MGVEIERKFRISGELLASISKWAYSTCHIEQVYLAAEIGEVRVRKTTYLKSGRPECCLTFKCPWQGHRMEIENPITLAEYEHIKESSGKVPIIKTRYFIPHQNNELVVDKFLNAELEDLLMAEIEFYSAKQCDAFEPLFWMGEELTGNPVFSNKYLFKLVNMPKD